ncbi:MAG: hypothetical protein WA354_16755 [Terracidiphilus sp.]
MEQSKSDASIANDVLHNEDHSKLTQEEIAKAVAHHNKRHKEDHSQDAKAKGAQKKKQGAEKLK